MKVRKVMMVVVVYAVVGHVVEGETWRGGERVGGVWVSVKGRKGLHSIISNLPACLSRSLFRP